MKQAFVSSAERERGKRRSGILTARYQGDISTFRGS